MAGIYIHIPFCKQACHYCDFHFSTRQDQLGEMINAIDQELFLQQSYLAGEEIKTVYFGGGTPSLAPATDITRLLNTIRKNFRLFADAEITLEANPDDLSVSLLHALRLAGVNRLSIGIQSFDDAVLKYLNRAHDAHASLKCVEDARRAGFDNLSIDLIYAIPGQSHNTWLKNIEAAIALKPQHISAYSLTIEDKTVFGKWAAQGKIPVMGDEIAAEQLETLVSRLADAGYVQYEVSNFSLPGFESKHNSSYWQQQLYLGAGPSAHSYNGVSRQSNVSNNQIYLKSLAANKIPATVEMLTTADKVNDYLMTTLRTRWGADISFLRTALGYDLEKLHRPYLETLMHSGLALMEGDKLYLTTRGRLLADKISSDLFMIHQEG